MKNFIPVKGNVLPVDIVPNLLRRKSHMDKLKILDKKIRGIFDTQGILVNTGMNLRSCGCEVLRLDFSALIQETFRLKKDDLLSIVSDSLPGWNLYYISAFPGTNHVKKVYLRKLCDRCKADYIKQGMGPNIIVVSERL